MEHRRRLKAATKIVMLPVANENDARVYEPLTV